MASLPPVHGIVGARAGITGAASAETLLEAADRGLFRAKLTLHGSAGRPCR